MASVNMPKPIDDDDSFDIISALPREISSMIFRLVLNTLTYYRINVIFMDLINIINFIFFFQHAGSAINEIRDDG